MYFSVYYINKIQRKTIKRPWQCVLQQIIFSHEKISYFLRVFKYDFSQWPKTLYNTYVYIINNYITRFLEEKLKGYNLKEWRSGLAHEKASLESSTAGFRYASKTCSDGKPIGSEIFF